MDRVEKIEIIGKLYGNNSCTFAKDLLHLMSGMIDETRAQCDDADVPTIRRNQGKIEVLKALRDYILKGVPPKNDLNGGKLNLI